jgi:hypothetical protein
MARWDRIITSGNVEDRRGTGPAMAFVWRQYFRRLFG